VIEVPQASRARALATVSAFETQEGGHNAILRPHQGRADEHLERNGRQKLRNKA
jgi:hypothetical protein